MADLGRFAVLAALVLAVYALIAAALGSVTRRWLLVTSGVRALVAVAVMEALAAGMLVGALVSHDYRFAYVVSHVSDSQSLLYNITSFWGGMEGSMLLWAMILSGYSLLAVRSISRRRPVLLPGVVATCAGVAAFFLFMLAGTTSPFVTSPFPPADGQGMNPLLLNTWMAIHPPTLYLGFVGLTVPFAIVIASLAARPVDEAGVLLARPWMLWAWYCLSMGLMFGAKWSYVVLGWGGYWAWDPVENAALMPWLVSTAFLHSVMIQERRGMLKQWTALLVVLAFGLSIFGTFLTRSGVLSSIHSFTQSSLGAYFLGFLALVMLVGFGAVAWRWDELRGENTLDSVLSRESAFLLNNAVLLSMAFAVFLGTIFPVLSEAVTGRRTNVGPPFFDHVVAPLALVLLLLMGIGPLIAWRRASAANLRNNFLAPGAAGVLFGLALVAAGVRAAGAVLAFSLCGFVAATIALEFARGIRVQLAHGSQSVIRACAALVMHNRRRYGGYIVHLGMLLLLVGVTASSIFSTQRVVTLRPGDTVRLGAYAVRFDGLQQSIRNGAGGSLVVAARLRIFNGGRDLGSLEARRNLFLAGQESTTDVALRSTPRDDLYVTLTGWTISGDATVRLLVNPLVMWIWAGGLVLTAGAIITMLPERRSLRVPLPMAERAWGAETP